jgi:hypothetical protein
VNSHWSERGPHEPPAGPGDRSNTPVAPPEICPDGPPFAAQGGRPFEVRVPTPGAVDIVVDVRAGRADVVHRLLDLGVSRCTLMALLPEWSELIASVASKHFEYR